MSPELIPILTKERMELKGAKSWRSVHTQYWVYPGKQIQLGMFSNVLFLVGNPMGVTIESELGTYGFDNENIHEHQGMVYIDNTIEEAIAVEFVKIIITE